MPISEDRQQEIVKSLKRCNEASVSAALRFAETRDVSELPAIILGVLERDAANPRPAGIASATDDMRLMEDIGMDSFGMIEVIMTAEEVLGITITTEEMKGIETLGDLKRFLHAKLGTVAS